MRTKTATICSSDKAKMQRQMKDCTEVKYVSIKNDPKHKIHLLTTKVWASEWVSTCTIFQYNTQTYACIPWGQLEMEMEIHATRLLILFVRATKFPLLFIRPYRQFIHAAWIYRMNTRLEKKEGKYLFFVCSSLISFFIVQQSNEMKHGVM